MSQQDGGRILGEGVYGCAFDPPLHCVRPKQGIIIKDKSAHRVGKITSIASGQKEFSISQMLAQQPNAESYFTLIESLCTPEPRSKQTEEDLKRCEFASGQSLPNLTQITMPFAGRPLRVVPKTVANMDFFSLGRQLLEAGTLLLMANVVHRDIHPQNILVDQKQRARLIDFGLAWSPEALTLANLSSLFLKFDPRFLQEPPEVSVINGYNQKASTGMILARIADEKTILKLKERVFALPIQQQMQQLNRFLLASESIQSRNAYSFFKLYWSKLDSWAIGANLLTVYTDMLFDPAFEASAAYKKRNQTARKVMLGLLSMDAAYRLDCAEALEMWAPDSPVLERKEVKQWLKEAKNTRKQL